MSLETFSFLFDDVVGTGGAVSGRWNIERGESRVERKIVDNFHLSYGHDFLTFGVIELYANIHDVSMSTNTKSF